MSWWLSHISVDIAIWLPELKLEWFFYYFLPGVRLLYVRLSLSKLFFILDFFSRTIRNSLKKFVFFFFKKVLLKRHFIRKAVSFSGSKCKCKCVQILISGNRVGAKWEITFLHRNISERRKLKSFFVPKPIYIYIKISWKKIFWHLFYFNVQICSIIITYYSIMLILLRLLLIRRVMWSSGLLLTYTYIWFEILTCNSSLYCFS